MDARLALTSRSFDLTGRLVRRAVDGMDRSALLRRVTENCNSMLWMVGHMTLYRSMLLGLLGGAREACWEDLFKRGAGPADESFYPSLEELLAEFDAVTVKLNANFEAATEAELGAPAAKGTPSLDGTLAGSAAFLAFHEGYHAGQMGLLRKQLGFGQLVG